jgi:hypothetical protein
MPTDPVVKVDKSGKIPVYTVRKVLSDEETAALKGKFMEEKHFPIVLKESADVIDEEGNYILRFRKDVLPKGHVDDAYEALKEFIKKTTTDRGTASGSEKGLGTGQKKPVMSNIIGFFDKWSISQKSTFKRSGIKAPGPCRLCAFNAKFPEKWKKVVPLIQEIDTQYKALCPKEHADQVRAAKSTAYVIKGTAFSTVTTNLNFRTAAHTDSGDWPSGFGNLVVIEKGASYEGNYTGFPQYGCAVDCRNGDFLAMDVHQVHGNTPMKPKDETSQRLSLVSYLREGIVGKCKGAKLYDAEDLERRLGAWRAKQTRKAKRGGSRGEEED